jgi:hypothetical protein
MQNIEQLFLAQSWWLKAVVLTTWEAEIGRIEVLSQPR